MRPLFWPANPANLPALDILRWRPSRDVQLAGAVAAGTVATSWTAAMIAAVVILSG